MRMRPVGKLVHGDSYRAVELTEHEELGPGDAEARFRLAVEDPQGADDAADGVQDIADVAGICMGSHIFIIGFYAL